MKEEADHIIRVYGLEQVKKLKNITVYENEKIVMVLAGIGKIQASIGAAYLFQNYEISKLVNIGIAGSLRGKSANIGDVFIVTKIFQHDMYLPFEGPHLDYAKGSIYVENGVRITEEFQFNVHHNAFCLTGDQFIDDQMKVLELTKMHQADTIEMEAFAIASVAREYDSLNKCIFIKAISDGADNDAKEAHMGNLDFAMKNSLEVLGAILK